METPLVHTACDGLPEDELEALAKACLGNRWLQDGVQYDADALSEYASMLNIRSMDSISELRQFFLDGSHRVREGAVFGALAFVQQGSLGDEWLTLSLRFNDDTGERFWVPFESITMEGIAASEGRFERTIRELEDADPFEIAFIRTAPSRQRRTRSIS